MKNSKPRILYNMVWIFLITGFAVVAIVLYSCLVSAKRADEAMKEYFKKKSSGQFD